jgi:hypothetical protein
MTQFDALLLRQIQEAASWVPLQRLVAEQGMRMAPRLLAAAAARAARLHAAADAARRGEEEAARVAAHRASLRLRRAQSEAAAVAAATEAAAADEEVGGTVWGGEQSDFEVARRAGGMPAPAQQPQPWPPPRPHLHQEQQQQQQQQQDAAPRLPAHKPKYSRDDYHAFLMALADLAASRLPPWAAEHCEAAEQRGAAGSGGGGGSEGGGGCAQGLPAGEEAPDGAAAAEAAAAGGGDGSGGGGDGSGSGGGGGGGGGGGVRTHSLSGVHMSASSAAELLWAYAKIGFHPGHASVGAWAGVVAAKARSADDVALCQAVWALAVLGHVPWERHWGALLAQLAARLPRLKARGLANVLWALATLEQTPSGGFMRAFWAASRGRLAGDAAPQALSNLLWAAARLGVAPPVDWLDAWLAAAAGERLGAWRGGDAANALWAFATLRMPGWVPQRRAGAVGAAWQQPGGRGLDTGYRVARVQLGLQGLCHPLRLPLAARTVTAPAAAPPTPPSATATRPAGGFRSCWRSAGRASTSSAAGSSRRWCGPAPRWGSRCRRACSATCCPPSCSAAVSRAACGAAMPGRPSRLPATKQGDASSAAQAASDKERAAGGVVPGSASSQPWQAVRPPTATQHSTTRHSTTQHNTTQHTATCAPRSLAQGARLGAAAVGPRAPRRGAAGALARGRGGLHLAPPALLRPAGLWQRAVGALAARRGAGPAVAIQVGAPQRPGRGCARPLPRAPAARRRLGGLFAAPRMPGRG